MSKKQDKPVEIDENELDEVSGGLPAVQKVREAATRTSTSPTDTEPTTNIIAVL